MRITRDMVLIGALCLISLCIFRLATGTPTKPLAAVVPATAVPQPPAGGPYRYSLVPLQIHVSARPLTAMQETRSERAAAAARKLRRREVIAARLRDKSDPDDLAFVRWLLPAARGGDVDAQKMVAAAMKACELWNQPHRDGKTWRDRLNDPTWAAGKELRFDVEERQARCDPLSAASVEEIGSTSGWRAKALAAGDGEALIEDAEDAGNGMDGDERVRTFNHALADADPAVLNSIIVQTPEFQKEMHDSGWIGSNPQVAMRDLALCQLGDDCSMSGDSLKYYCSSDACRGIDSVQRYFEMHLSLQQFADAQQSAQYYVDRFLDGGDNWPEAQAYERYLRQLGAGG